MVTMAEFLNPDRKPLATMTRGGPQPYSREAVEGRADSAPARIAKATASMPRDQLRARYAELRQVQRQKLDEHKQYAGQLQERQGQVELKQRDLLLTKRVHQLLTDPAIHKQGRSFLMDRLAMEVNVDPKSDYFRQLKGALTSMPPDQAAAIGQALVGSFAQMKPGAMTELLNGLFTGKVPPEELMGMAREYHASQPTAASEAPAAPSPPFQPEGSFQQVADQPIGQSPIDQSFVPQPFSSSPPMPERAPIKGTEAPPTDETFIGEVGPSAIAPEPQPQMQAQSVQPARPSPDDYGQAEQQAAARGDAGRAKFFAERAEEIRKNRGAEAKDKQTALSAVDMLDMESRSLLDVMTHRQFEPVLRGMGDYAMEIPGTGVEVDLPAMFAKTEGILRRMGVGDNADLQDKFDWINKHRSAVSTKVIDEIMQMKQQSQTGATGFGQLSNKELEVVKTARASLTTGSSPEAYRENGRTLLLHTLRARSGIAHAYASTTGQGLPVGDVDSLIGYLEQTPAEQVDWDGVKTYLAPKPSLPPTQQRQPAAAAPTAKPARSQPAVEQPPASVTPPPTEPQPPTPPRADAPAGSIAGGYAGVADQERQQTQREEARSVRAEERQIAALELQARGQQASQALAQAKFDYEKSRDVKQDEERQRARIANAFQSFGAAIAGSVRGISGGGGMPSYPAQDSSAFRLTPTPQRTPPRPPGR